MAMTTIAHHPQDVVIASCAGHVRESGDASTRTVFFQDGQWQCAEHMPRPAELPDMLEAQRAGPPPTLAARLRDVQRYARIDALAGDHRLGRWQREQTGRSSARSSSATCTGCQGRAYAHVGPDGQNHRNGPAVLLRCPAVAANRCQEMATPARTVTLYDANGRGTEAGVACGHPYLVVWVSGLAAWETGPGLKLCSEHARAYRAIAAGPNPHGWRQRSGPTDY